MAGVEPASRVFKCVIPSSTEALPLSYITMARLAGFEPAKCRSQSPVPYHLATV